MTKPEFAELKEKLIKFNEAKAWNAANLVFQPDRPHQEWHQLGAQYQHAKSAAIIKELLEIIQSQSEALDHACNYLKDTGVEKIEDCEPDKQMYGSFIKALSETNTRLQKLMQEKCDHEPIETVFMTFKTTCKKCGVWLTATWSEK